MGKNTRIDEQALSQAPELPQDGTGLALTAKVVEGIGENDVKIARELPTPPVPPAPEPDAVAPADVAPAPLWAPHEHVPQEGGSFVRQPDGSLLRTEEEEA